MVGMAWFSGFDFSSSGRKSIFRTAAPGWTGLVQSIRGFFVRLGGSGPAIQFARISSLDACVCKIMSSILNKNSKVAKIELLERIAKKIRHDESGHVKLSRKHIADLGVSDQEFYEVDNHVRLNIVSLFESVGSSFEALGVDPDKLFKKILRGRNL